MKHVKKIIFCVLLLGYSAKMQAQTLDSLQLYLNYVISGLDTSKIQTKMLYDKTTHWADLSKYNGVYDTVTTYIDVKQLLIQINRMQLDTLRIIPPNYLDWKLQKFDSLNVNPLIILNYKYDKIKINALDSGWLDTTGGQLIDGTNTSQSPYEQKFISTATFAFPSMGYTSTARFVCDRSLYFTNYTSPPASLYIDFADGNGYKNVNWGDTVTINYSTENISELTIKIKYDENLLDAKKTYYKTYAKTGNGIDATFTFEASIPYGECDKILYFVVLWYFGSGIYSEGDMQDFYYNNRQLYDAIVANGKRVMRPVTGSWEPCKGRGKVSVIYGIDPITNQKHTCPTKPLIFVEGIDFGYRGRRIGCLDGKCGSMGLIDLVRGQELNLGASDEADDAFAEKFAQGPALISNLTNEGFDIYYVDFENGVDLMQRNAMFVVELINRLNRGKCSCEDLVVVGASMGGQVARYALAYMESHNMEHSVRDFVLWDSPNKGANVALGLQYFLQYFAPEDANANENLELINKPAVPQLVNNYYNNSGAVDGARIDFMNEINSMGGYPKQCRKTALSNGGKNGVSSKVNFADGAMLAKLYKSKYDVLPFIAKIFGPVFYDVNGEIKALCSTPFWGTMVKTVRITSAPNYCQTWDNCPGGMFTAIHGLDGKSGITVYNGRTTFIPIISGLDINTWDVNFNVLSNLSDPDLPNPSLYPFDAYYAPASNQLHVTITDDNIIWLHDELATNSIADLNLNPLLPNNSKNIFNYGYYNMGRLPSLGINNNGILAVNQNYRIKYQTSSDINSVPSSTYYLRTKGCSTVVSVNSGGAIILGDVVPTGNNNKAQLIFVSGSTLNLNSGSTLTINDNSKLIIESGATLNITGTPTINLSGNNAVIEIKDGGVLNIPSGSTFTYSGSGYLKIFGGDGSHIVATGDGAIIIAGTGTGATQTHKILEFASSPQGNKVVFVHPQVFEVSGGLISSNCEVDFNMPLILHDVTYNGANNNCYNTVTANTCKLNSGFYCENTFYANHCNLNAPINCFHSTVDFNVDILNCDNLSGNLTATNITNGYRVYVTMTTFNMGDNGDGAVHLIGSTGVFTGVHFTDNDLGLKAEYSDNVYCGNCTFDGTYSSSTSTGINFSGNVTSSLSLSGVNILNMTNAGVVVHNSNLFARCGNIKNTSVVGAASISLKTDAILTLAPGLTSSSPFASVGPLGNMDLSGFSKCITSENAQDIYLDNSGSNLATMYFDVHPTSYYGVTFEGNLQNPPTGGVLYARQNYWTGGGAPYHDLHWPNFYYNPNVWFDNNNVNSSGYLTTTPNITNSCQFYSTGGGGGSYGKTGVNYSSKIFDNADSIPFENGHSLKHAVKAIFDDDIDTTASGINAQLNSHEQILKHNFGTLKNKARPVVELIYQRMQLTIGVGLKHGVIQPIQSSTQINRLIIMQDTLFGRTTINDSTKRFTLLKDKALALRLANRRSDALTFLSRAHGYADSTNKRFIEKWQCFIEKEIMLHDSIISKKQFLTLVKRCGVRDTTNNRFSKRNPNNRIPQQQEKIISTMVAASNNLEVKLYPNPAFDNLNIVINNISDESKINIQIIDIVGRVMQTQTSQINIGQENLTINIPISLSSGTYLVKLEGEKINETKRFVVMK